MALSMTREEMLNILWENSSLKREEQEDYLFCHIVSRLGVEKNCDMAVQVKQILRTFFYKLYVKLKKQSNNKQKMINAEREWLQIRESFLESAEYDPKERGRPKKDFPESSIRTKMRKTETLRQGYSAAELSFSSQMKLRAEGKEQAAKLVSEATNTTPTRATKIRRTWRTSQDANLQIKKYTADEALSLIVECSLSKKQYLSIRIGAKSRNSDMYPSYKRILEAKSNCYPNKSSISVTEVKAEINLQALLDHTTTRIATFQEPVIESLSTEILSSLVLITKYGFDGSSGQALHKQRASSDEFSDSDIFLSSVVPLELFSETSEGKTVVWHNPRPSSTRYCRPLRIQFQKETPDLLRSEQAAIANEIETLEVTRCVVGGREVQVKHKLVLTMVDGKVCNALTHTDSAMTCYICGATPSKMNDIDSAHKKEVVASTLEFGLSTLHAWIRFFEWLLHVSYRLEIKKWQARTPSDKESVKTRKAKIQSEFKKETGLLVDVPKPGGSGTTNDGNTARRFFRNPSLTAKITGIEENIIQRCGNILAAISSGYNINVQAFEKYALDTAKLYVDVYPWYYMPASVHKVLVHGSSIIACALLPIGQMSEEAQEARHKDVKRFRRDHSRKRSRVTTNEDVLNALLVSSDPVITGLRILPRKKKVKSNTEFLGLLQQPDVQLHASTSSTSHDSSGESTDYDPDSSD